jgi:hypothetical protein
VLSKDKEILEIDGRNLAPMSSTGVTNLFESMKKETINVLPGILTEAERVNPKALTAEEASIF